LIRSLRPACREVWPRKRLGYWAKCVDLMEVKVFVGLLFLSCCGARYCYHHSSSCVLLSKKGADGFRMADQLTFIFTDAQLKTAGSYSGQGPAFIESQFQLVYNSCGFSHTTDHSPSRPTPSTLGQHDSRLSGLAHHAPRLAGTAAHARGSHRLVCA
jgi:hypothetical protein